MYSSAAKVIFNFTFMNDVRVDELHMFYFISHNVFIINITIALF